jgi:hypothetical protein
LPHAARASLLMLKEYQPFRRGEPDEPLYIRIQQA